ncbi:FAR1-related protein [Sesbania bispinosa]|nr:FAR1-related protein [Sesbania bispinosa]
MMEQTETNNTAAVDPKNSKSPNKDNLDSHHIPEGYKRISELTDEDIRGLEFDTEEDAYDFYCEEGERSEKHLNRTDRIREAKLIRHRLNGLHHYGVRTCHIMGLIMGQKGGYSDLGFCEKDLYNHIDKENRAKIEDGDAFAALCYLQSNRQKFEDEWSKVVDKHGLRENRTTYICEGINSFIKRYVQSKNSLVDFLHNFERALNEYRHNELTSDFKSKYTQPVMTTTLERYEVQASNVYTRNKFFDVRKQIEKVVAINVIERTDVGNVVTMEMNKFETLDSTYIVMLDKSNGNLVDKVAKVEHISSVYAEEDDTSKKDLLRSGVVGAACNRLNKAARRNPHNFVKNIESIHKLAEQMERQEVRICTKYATRDQLDTALEEESSIETDEDSRDEVSRDIHFSNHLNDVTVSAGQNCASDKVSQSKKKRKNSEGLKLTQESVNERRFSDVNKAQQNDTGIAFNRMNTPSLFGNHLYYPNMNALSISTPVHIRPSMIHGLGQGFVGNRAEDMRHYPQMYMQQSLYTPPVVHNVNAYGNSLQFTNAVNNIERNNGVGRKKEEFWTYMKR